jgi:hypothetical protein
MTDKLAVAEFNRRTDNDGRRDLQRLTSRRRLDRHLPEADVTNSVRREPPEKCVVFP